jgi:hypothetical protein
MKAKVSFPLYISTLNTKKQHKKSTKHVKITMFFLKPHIFFGPFWAILSVMGAPS